MINVVITKELCLIMNINWFFRPHTRVRGKVHALMYTVAAWKASFLKL